MSPNGGLAALVLAAFALFAFLFVLRANWPIVAALIWVATLVASSSNISPYSTTDFGSRGRYVAAIGAMLFVGAWSLARRGGTERSKAPKYFETSAFRYVLLLTALLLVGVAGILLAYQQTGLPLFQSDIDAARAAAQPPLVPGLMRDAITVGGWVAVAALMGRLKVPSVNRLFHLGWLGLFVVAAVVGGSRNTVLFAIAPAYVGLASAPMRGLRRFGARAAPAMGLAAAILTLSFLAIAGQRILNGQGVLEDQIRAQSGGAVLVAGIDVSITNLAAPIETLGRLDAYADQPGVLGDGRYSTLSLSTIYKYWTPRANLYDVTQVLSQPYYQNVATFLGPLVLDGGRIIAFAIAAILGVVVGLVEKRGSRSTTLAARLLSGYVVYCALFSPYECLPCLYGDFFAVVPLTLLAQKWLFPIQRGILATADPPSATVSTSTRTSNTSRFPQR